MAIGGWNVRVAALVALSLVAQILPGVLDMPGGAKPAAADPITPWLERLIGHQLSRPC
jgi:hypothetical protein